jgi:ribosomal protein S8
VRQHLVVNRRLAVCVQSHPGQVLQSQIAVVIDFRVLEPRRQIGRLARVARQEVERGEKSDALQGRGHLLMIATVQPVDELVHIDLQRLRLGKDYDVVSPAGEMTGQFRSQSSGGEIGQPAPSIGYVVLTTSAGIMDHEEARRKHFAGKILGCFY